MIRQNTGKAGLHFLPVSQPSLCQQGMRQHAFSRIESILSLQLHGVSSSFRLTPSFSRSFLFFRYHDRRQQHLSHLHTSQDRHPGGSSGRHGPSNPFPSGEERSGTTSCLPLLMQSYKGMIDLYIPLFLAFSTNRRLYVLKRVIREKLAAPCLSWQSDLVPCRSYRKSSTQSTTPSGPPLPSSLALPRSSSLRPPSSVSRPVATLPLRVCRSRTDTFTTSAITAEHTIHPLRRNLYSGTDPSEYKSLKVPRLDPDDFFVIVPDVEESHRCRPRERRPHLLPALGARSRCARLLSSNSHPRSKTDGRVYLSIANQGEQEGVKTVSASPIPLSGTSIIPEEMTEEDIKRKLKAFNSVLGGIATDKSLRYRLGYVGNYKQAAINAVKEAGFDGVEIHSANGQWRPNCLILFMRYGSG